MYLHPNLHNHLDSRKYNLNETKSLILNSQLNVPVLSTIVAYGGPA
jgi:hypothetical protein